MKKLIDREMTKEEINNVKCFDDLMFRKSKHSTKDITKRVLTASFENGNRISCIEEISDDPSYQEFDCWNCIVSIVTDKDTNEVTTEHHELGEHNIALDDNDEFLRIFLLNRNYTYKTCVTHTLIHN
tara:strand:- start:179 stop:559 length:381 start_codon:yes stop_codon:yes gene_type:complete